MFNIIVLNHITIEKVLFHVDDVSTFKKRRNVAHLKQHFFYCLTKKGRGICI